MSVQVSFQPGSIVAARGREWIVLPDSDNQVLHLRPMGAAEEDKTVIFSTVGKKSLLSRLTSHYQTQKHLELTQPAVCCVMP